MFLHNYFYVNCFLNRIRNVPQHTDYLQIQMLDHPRDKIPVLVRE